MAPMAERAGRFYRALAEGALLAAALVVPLWFAIFTVQVFEPAKAALLRGLVLLAVVAWGLAWWAWRGERSGWRTLAWQPILLAGTAVWGVGLLATAASVAPWISLMGAATRGQGWLTTTALFGLMWLAAALVTDEQALDRLAGFIALGALPAGLYGLVQALRLDPLPWEGDVISRVAGPAGNSVMLAAYLAMALPFGLLWLARAWRSAAGDTGWPAGARLASWILVVTFGLAGLVLSGSRGPMLGLVVGSGILALAQAARVGRWRVALGLAALGSAAVVGVIALNVAPQQFGGLARLPLLDRLSVALNPERDTTRVRLRLWEGSTAALAHSGSRLVLGHGPETTDLVWAPFYPPILAYDEPRGLVPDRAHNLALDTLLATGMLGLAATLAFLTALVGACLRLLGLAADRFERGSWWVAWLGGGWAGLLLAVGLDDGRWRLAGVAAGLGLVGGLAAWLGLVAWRRGHRPGDRSPGRPPPSSESGLLTTPRLADRFMSWVEEVGFAGAALVAVIAHLVEVQVGFGVTATGVLLGLIAGGLVARLAMTARPAGEPAAMAGVRGEGLVAALLVGTTLVFDFVHPGLVGGGSPVVVAVVGLAVLLTGAALEETAGAAWWRRWPAVVLAGTALYALVDLGLLRLGRIGAAEAVWSAVLALVGYAVALVLLLVARARREAGAWPGRREAVAGLLVLGMAGLPAARLLGAPLVAEALAKEGELGWQQLVSPLRAKGETGKAESFLDRARDRYRWATRLAPWEPAYGLAVAREEVERADLLDERLSRALADGGVGTAADEYDLGLLAGRAVAWARARDAAFAVALAEIARAEALAPTAPGTALTRARALRVWGDRTRESRLRHRRLVAARAAYTHAMALAPQWPEVLDEAAVTALLDGDPAGALALTGRAVQLDPFYLRAWRTAAAAQAHRGDDAAATAAYERYFADARNASDLPARRGQLEVLVRLRRDAAALVAARAIVQLAPDDARSFADLAVLQQRAGDRAAALEAARQAVALAPDDPAIAALLNELSPDEAP
jgi:tetratricopeptide (TPR) repeat protein